MCKDLDKFFNNKETLILESIHMTQITFHEKNNLRCFHNGRKSKTDQDCLAQVYPKVLITKKKI